MLLSVKVLRLMNAQAHQVLRSCGKGKETWWLNVIISLKISEFPMRDTELGKRGIHAGPRNAI